MDNFIFDIIDLFLGYNSSQDRTNLKPGFLVRGSQNVYKKRSGTIASRPGLKRRGSVDTTEAGVVAEYVFHTSHGVTLPLRVCNNKLQVESDQAISGTNVWYDLLLTSTLLSPAASLTRFIFDTWWEAKEQKNRLLMVRGDSNVLHWSGGLTKVSGGTAAGTSQSILTFTLDAAGTGYAVDDIVAVANGNGGMLRVATISGSGIATLTLITPGQSYSIGVHSLTNILSAGSGGQVNVTATTTSGTITKSDTSTTFLEDGLADWNPDEQKIIIGGVEYQYSSVGDSTLFGVTTDASGIAVDSIAIQSVFSQSLVTEIADDDFAADFLKTLNNQICYGSYSSTIIHISANETISQIGFSNLLNAGALIPGDPDFVVLDGTCNGMTTRKGSLYVSSGTSDWYEITPNTPAPVAFTDSNSFTRYVLTKVEKKTGTGNSGLLAHEFIDVKGDNIYYLGKDHQLGIIGTFTQIEGTRFPSVSQPVYEELQEEDFTDGHLKSFEDTIYITAPISGRHWMYQIREGIDTLGQITAERVWQPPQIAGISRFSDIAGVLYGHSNRNPQLYQVWDTNQWHDDDPTEADIPYTSVARFSYGHTPTARGGMNRAGLCKFDRIYYEGFMANGSIMYGKSYLDYKGATDIQDFEINTNESSASLFLGGQVSGVGSSTLGSNPLGDGIVEEANDQATLNKFRAICQAQSKDCFEYELEVHSVDLDSRWELVALGTNVTPSENSPTFLGK